MIPSSVENIGSYAFCKCAKLKQVTFESPSKLTSIKDGVFKSCSLLAKISIPPSVTSIDYMAFNGCCNLSEIEIPPSVNSFAKYCFLECRRLKEVVISSSATIDEEAFDSSTKVLKT